MLLTHQNEDDADFWLFSTPLSGKVKRVIDILRKSPQFGFMMLTNMCFGCQCLVCILSVGFFWKDDVFSLRGFNGSRGNVCYWRFLLSGDVERAGLAHWMYSARNVYFALRTVKSVVVYGTWLVDIEYLEILRVDLNGWSGRFGLFPWGKCAWTMHCGSECWIRFIAFTELIWCWQDCLKFAVIMIMVMMSFYCYGWFCCALVVVE